MCNLPYQKQLGKNPKTYNQVFSKKGTISILDSQPKKTSLILQPPRSPCKGIAQLSMFTHFSSFSFQDITLLYFFS